MLKRSLGRLNGWLSYTYSRTLLRQNDPSVPNPVNNGQWYPAAYDKPHDVKFVGNFKITHQVQFFNEPRLQHRTSITLRWVVIIIWGMATYVTQIATRTEYPIYFRYGSFVQH